MNNKYELIDNDLNKWCSKYGLSIYYNYQETPVRSIDIVDNSGNRFQLWIEINKDKYIVKLWDYSKRKWEKESPTETISNVLDEAYKVFETWIEENGTKRTFF